MLKLTLREVDHERRCNVDCRSGRVVDELESAADEGGDGVVD